MHAIRIISRCCAAIVLVSLACNGSESTGPTTGAVQVRAATTGADMDLDGYTVAVDSSAPQPLGVNGTVTFVQLDAGSHTLTIGGVALNCGVVGENPRTVSVAARGTVRITIQFRCGQRVDLSGVWNYTERFGDPLACNDTGSYVLTPVGDGFDGTGDQVGTCDQQNGSVDNSFLRTFTDGVEFLTSASGPMAMRFPLGSCVLSAEIAGTPPDRLINGSIECPSFTGTWEAVRGGGPITSVAVSPPTPSMVAGGTAQLRAIMIDASGSRRVGPTVTWSSDASAVATVDGSGVVTGVAPGSATITASAETKSGTATANVEVVRFATVHAGAFHSCGLTAGGAYCWGNGTYGQLGNGAKANGLVPVAVSDGASLVSISVGAVHTCGLTTTGAAYCWGLDYYGELGAGTPAPQRCGIEDAPCSTTPLAVAATSNFASVSAGWVLSCALTPGGAAYCWGDNTHGGLGNGTTASTRTPVAVTSAPPFVSVGTGNLFACGLTADGAAYCWGNNSAGQLGIGPGGPDVCSSEPCSKTPVAVLGNLTLSTISVGYWHVCGLASSGVYCWGDNDGGQLGATTTESCAGFGAVIGCSTVPVPVESDLLFATVSSGSFHSCGFTSAGEGYCWGANGNGQLGNGTTTDTPTPMAMTGGLSFKELSAFGRWHSCGLSTASVAYCWGYDSWGQLGYGATFDVHEPVTVAGQAAVSGTTSLRASGVRRTTARAGARPPSLRPSGPARTPGGH